MTRKRYTGFCGIDVAKNKHVACVIDQDGEFIIRSQSFKNDAEGFQRIQGCLGKVGGSEQVVVALEATGHYWYSIHDFLRRQDYQVAVLNPIQTAQQAKKGIRKSKTDKIDARHIATLLKNGEHKPALVPGELGMTCRPLTRSLFRFVWQSASLKQLLRAHLHPVWPEFETLFAKPFCATGRKLLLAAPTPADALALDRQQLIELIRITSRGKYGTVMANKIYQAAQNSVGMLRGLEGSRLVIRNLITQIEAAVPMRSQIENQIEPLLARLPQYILTLPGVSPITAVSLYGETDPFETFTQPEKLVAFAGLEPVVFQTGQYDATRRRISKRGSPYLRQTLWRMARLSSFQEGDLRDYYLRKRQQGLHHLAAVTAVAAKLARITWRIMIDRRDYLPLQPTQGS